MPAAGLHKERYHRLVKLVQSILSHTQMRPNLWCTAKQTDKLNSPPPSLYSQHLAKGHVPTMIHQSSSLTSPSTGATIVCTVKNSTPWGVGSRSSSPPSDGGGPLHVSGQPQSPVLLRRGSCHRGAHELVSRLRAFVQGARATTSRRDTIGTRHRGDGGRGETQSHY